jgi:hypothetical protein
MDKVFDFREIARRIPTWKEDFQNLDFMSWLADEFIEELFLKRREDEAAQKVRITMSAFARMNFETAFDFAESPIEKIFLSQVILSFFRNDPALLIVPYYHLTKFVEDMLWAGKLDADISRLAKEHNESWFEIAERKLTRPDLYNFIYHRNNLRLGRMDSVYMFPQFSFKNTSHLGDEYKPLEGIRVDIFFTKLNSEKYKLVVECDGYEWHKSKDSFIRDRKRDRALKAAGYDVFRFSGTEIIRDPISCGSELHKYIMNNWEFSHPTFINAKKSWQRKAQ